MWCFALQLLALLLRFTSQTVGQTVTEEVCSVKHYGETNVSYIMCPPGGNVRHSNVWFKFNKEGDSLDITCNKNLSAEQLESYLASVARVKKKTVNLTRLKVKGCPAPGGSESFGTWLTLLGSHVGSLRKLGLISTISSRVRGDDTILKSEHFAGLTALTAIEISGSVKTLGPKLLANLISLEEFKSSGAKLTSVDELAFRQNKKLRTITIRNSTMSTIHKGTFRGLANLESLDLSLNKITSIPDEVIGFFKDNWKMRVKLGGNNFACDCHSLKLVQFLRNHMHQVLDRKEISFDCNPSELFRFSVTDSEFRTEEEDLTKTPCIL